MAKKQPAGPILDGAILRGPLFARVNSNAGQYAGITTLASGSATVVVSTTQANSDTLFLLGQVGNANVASGAVKGPIEVKTISPGAWFTLGTIDGVAVARDTLVHWMALQTTS